MPAETGMNNKQKLAALHRLNALSSSAEDLMFRGVRNRGDVDVLFDALQAFKEGRLTAVVTRQKDTDPEQIFRVCSLEIDCLPFAYEDLKALKRAGVRYVGEIFYVWFDPRSQAGIERGNRIAELLSRRFDLNKELDPLLIGWRPPYWDMIEFTAKLNLNILDLAPTPPRSESWQQNRLCRGLAREYHRRKLHFVGEMLRWGDNQQAPSGLASTGNLADTQRDLRGIGVNLWAAAIIPAGWQFPDWRTENWTKELEAMKVEAEEREAARGRRAKEFTQRLRETQVADVERIRTQAQEAPEQVRIDEIELSIRTGNVLLNASITNLRQLTERTPADILKMPNSGRKVLTEIRERLVDLGCKLKGD